MNCDLRIIEFVVIFLCGVFVGSTVSFGISVHLKNDAMNEACRRQHEIDSEFVKANGGPPLPPPDEYFLKGG